jgi:arylsulfatase A-like enzyme
VPTTLPSHASILTGTYPMLHGMHDFSGNRLNPAQPTLATILKAQGFATGAVIGAAVLDSRFGLNSGFDFYYDHFDFSRLLETNLDSMERPGHVVMDESLKWLEGHRQGRFLLWVHLYDPHYPYAPPPPFDRLYQDNPYDGEIAATDAQIGRLFQFLKTHGLYDRSLIVLTGDHGESLGEHGEKTHGFFVYDSTVRVPMIIKPPRQGAARPKPRVVQEVVSHVDLLPTMLAYLDVPPAAGFQGRSLLPLIAGKPEAEASPAYSETFLPRLHFNWSELRGLHRENYHFIEGPKAELYDLSKDPGERNNLYASRPALGSEIRGQLAEVIRRYTPDQELAEKTGLDPAMAERLKALGYAAVAAGASSTTLSNKDLPDPKDRIHVYELIASAIEDSQHGRFAPSIEKLNRAMETEKDSVPIHYLQGLNHYRMRDYAGSVRELSRVLELSPDYSLASYYLGLAYVGVRDWDTAIRRFQRTLELDPTNYSAAYNMGAAYLQKQAVPEAADALRKALEINPDYLQANVALAEVYLYQQQPDLALALLRKAVILAPGEPRVRSLLARAYQAKGMTAEAEQELREAERLRQSGGPNR